MRVDLICIALVVSSIGISASCPHPFLGISPQGEDYYRSSSDTIGCRDGSKNFTRAQLNDDFCDCLDGTDEPGTSACPRGKFLCRNAGHAPLKIFSSRVNDGFCDCCDGSDEYEGVVKCPNTCWEAGKVARDKLKKKIATYQEGVDTRRHEIERAKVAIANEEAELTKLKKERKLLKGIVEQLKDRKEQIKKEGSLQKEKQDKEKKQGVQGKREKAESKHNPIEVVEDSLSDQHAAIGTVLPEESKKDSADESKTDPGYGTKEKEPLDGEVGESEKTEGLSSEELGRLVASRWTGQNYGKKSHTAKHKDDCQIEEDAHHDSYDGDGGDMKDKTHEDHSGAHEYSSTNQAESNVEETTIGISVSWWEKVSKTVGSILKAVNPFQTLVDISEGEHVDKEYEESSAKLSEMKSRISNLTEKLKLDFGPEKEFFSFYDRCFEWKQNKYVYKVYPYKNATQMEGHTTTHLGNWRKFEKAYKVMVFSKGDKCGDGPDRSLKVKLRCGSKNEITDIDEPSCCEYVAQLATPAVCSEEKLKEFQEKLEELTKGQPKGRDEP